MNYQDFWRLLTAVYDDGEAKAIARLVMERKFGMNFTDMVCGATVQQTEIQQVADRLLTGEPVQYVLGEAEFGGRTFHVAPGVLIPRPETYELCSMCNRDVKDMPHPTILDMGTGSGCIACTLAADLLQADVTAWDLSDDALRIAAQNAQQLQVNIRLEKRDLLSDALPPLRNHFSVIISNPPYICEKESIDMERHVLEHEPAMALFVPDDDPLLFYRSIAHYAMVALQQQGHLYFELNPIYATETASMLRASGFHQVRIIDDQFGKQRFISACK